MKRDALILARGVVVMGGLMLTIAAAGLLFDVLYSHFPLGQVGAFNYTTARFMTDMTNRGLNQVLAIVFTVVAIAVPLTANLYSLKFLEFFVKDRVNALVLTLVVSADMASLWIIYSIKENYVPVFLLHVAFALLLICLALLFPYLYYVFRFLHPNTLLERLEDEIGGNLQAILRAPRRAASLRRPVSEAMEHIANIAIRSIDRADRITAIESVLTLERVGRAYWNLKDRLPHAWFVADPNLFRGFSAKAVDEFTASRSWFEMKLCSQLRLMMSAAVPRTHDVTDTIAKALCNLGMEDAAQRDVALREMVMEYFNTFARLALTRRDARSVFSVFDHYRIYAAVLNTDHPDFVLEIAYYFEYYGQVAQTAQLPFLVEGIAHDLGVLVQQAWEAGAPNRQKLLERLLRYDQQAKSPLPGVKKAQAILASYFLLTGQPAPAGLIRKNFEGLDPAFVHAIEDDLLHIKREKYWEVSERRINIDYVPDAQREKLRDFFASLRPLPRSRRTLRRQ